MSPLNYALQYEMSKKLSKLLYTVDDDIMSVEPLVGDSNYNSVATIRRNGKITRVKYNRKKLDDTLNEICLSKQTDYYGNTTYVCLAPVPSPVTADNLLSDWDAETTKKYLKSYELTWNRTLNNIMDTDNKIFNMVGNRNTKFSFMNAIYTTIGNDCTTHYGSTMYPVNFVKVATYNSDIADGLGDYHITAEARSIAENGEFSINTNYSSDTVPHKRQVIITTERLSAVNIRTGKYQGLILTYGDAEVELYDGWPYVKYNNQSIENTLPAIFSLKDGNDNDAIENSGIDYVAHPITLLGTGSNENKLYQLLVDLSVSEYFIYVIDQDYNYYGSDSQSK